MSLRVISDGAQSNYKRKIREQMKGKDGPVVSIPITDDLKKKYASGQQLPAFSSVRNFMNNIRSN